MPTTSRAEVHAFGEYMYSRSVCILRDPHVCMPCAKMMGDCYIRAAWTVFSPPNPHTSWQSLLPDSISYSQTDYREDCNPQTAERRRFESMRFAPVFDRNLQKVRFCRDEMKISVESHESFIWPWWKTMTLSRISVFFGGRHLNPEFYIMRQITLRHRKRNAKVLACTMLDVDFWQPLRGFRSFSWPP